jgi:hypothetical protein
VYLELEVGVEEEVLGLNVPMVDSARVAEGERIRELAKDGLGDVLWGGREGGREGGTGGNSAADLGRETTGGAPSLPPSLPPSLLTSEKAPVYIIKSKSSPPSAKSKARRTTSRTPPFFRG